MAQPRIIVVRFAPTSVSAKTDLWEITAAADRPVEIVGWTLFQTTDLGDANEEVLELTIERGVTAGSGGTASTEIDYGARGESTPDTAINHLVTTAHTGGTIIFSKGWNIRIPEEFWLPPELYAYFDAATDPTTVTMSAPADAITVGGTIFLREY